MKNIPETRLRLFITVLAILVLNAAGCIYQQPEILKVKPPEEKIELKASIPDAIIIFDSYDPPL